MDHEVGGDLIRLSEAAKIAGKTVQTLKRWVRNDLLTDRRPQGDTYSPVMVSRRELLHYLSQSTVVDNTPVHHNGGNDVRHDMVDLTPYETLIEELRSDKHKLESRVSRLESELQDTRQRLQDTLEARAALEREINGGVRGLLAKAAGKAVRRFF